MSGRRNHSCRDSVTVQHAPLISLFALSSLPPTLARLGVATPPGLSTAHARMREDRREYYRDCDIRGDSSSRDLRDSQPRSRRLRATSLGAKGAREGGEGGGG